MAHRTGLIADSTCDIPETLLARYEILVVPAYIVWGDDFYRDRVEMQPVEFYRRLEEDPVYPTTAHPTPEDFVKAYETLRGGGAEEIVVLTVSSAMSGTFDSAQQAGTQVNLPVHLVDAKGPTMSLGWQVLAAARTREVGGDAEAMVAAAAAARRTMVQYVALDTMEYLQKGGRIGRATQLIGSLLNIKPLVRIDHEAGLVESAGRARTHSRAVDALYATFFAELRPQPDERLHIAVLHGNVPDEAEALAERVRREHAPEELLINITGPVLGVHTGPRALALCGYAEAPHSQ